jgi:hypothetical protein
MGKATENVARVTRIGLDLAKTIFQVHGVGAQGELVIARKLRRGTMLEFFGRLPALIGVAVGAMADPKLPSPREIDFRAAETYLGSN